MVVDITFEKVGYVYQPDTPFQQRALYDLNMKIKEGSYTAIIGHTGSGKSTLLQHLNALIKPSEGTVTIGEKAITKDTPSTNLKEIRKEVGIVFQFPEAQLFEETVGKDIAFGPKNFGIDEESAMKRAKKMLQLVGLDDSYLERSPFDLSGGQMRRVAIAGVLAMEPKVLVLDEPTAGLDPQGQKDMMDMFYRLHKEQGITIVLVTHLMDDAAQYADQIIVMEKGTIVKKGKPADIFSDTDWLQSKQLGIPAATSFARQLEARGFHFAELAFTTDQLAEELVSFINTNKKVGETN